jgi:hypothetical protein
MPVQSSIHWKPLRDSHYVIASLEPAEGGRRQLVIKQAILLQLQTLARTAPTEQLAGLLLGTQYDCPVTGKRYVTIESLVRGAPIPDGSALEPTIRSLIGQVRGGGSMECVGWYCGTLVFEPRLRATHEAIHAAFFHERWQTALVISDYGNAGAFFLHDPQAARWFQSPFYEEIEPTRKPPPTKPTCVSWANYLTMDAVALMAPRPLAEAPSAPPPAPLSAPKRTQIAVAPPPPMPPRPIATHRPVVGPPLRRLGGVAVSGSKSSFQQLRDASSRVAGAVSRRGPEVRASATDAGKSIAGHVSSMVRASVSLIARTRDASARFIEREAARRKAAAAERAAVESARKAEAARQRAEAARAQEARDRADLLARRRAEAARLQAAREKEAARLRALREKEAAKLQAAREKEAAKLQAARDREAAKAQAAREKEAAAQAAREQEAARAQAAREQEAAKAQAARDREAAKAQAAREQEAARLQAAREKEVAKVQAAREKADAEARQRAEAARVLAEREQAELAARQKAEAARAAAPARPSVRRTETQPAAAVAAPPNQAPDLEDTTASDPPFRYLALAARDGFVLVTNSSGSDRLDFWLLDDSDSGMLLTVVTSDVSVREAILHYNVRTEDDALLQRTPAEYRDLETRTIYVRESVVDQLRARTKRLRATGELVREWKVSPPIELPHASRSSTMGLASAPSVADVALGTATRD